MRNEWVEKKVKNKINKTWVHIPHKQVWFLSSIPSSHQRQQSGFHHIHCKPQLKTETSDTYCDLISMKHRSLSLSVSSASPTYFLIKSSFLLAVHWSSCSSGSGTLSWPAWRSAELELAEVVASPWADSTCSDYLIHFQLAIPTAVDRHFYIASVSGLLVCTAASVNAFLLPMESF